MKDKRIIDREKTVEAIKLYGKGWYVTKQPYNCRVCPSWSLHSPDCTEAHKGTPDEKVMRAEAAVLKASEAWADARLNSRPHTELRAKLLGKVIRLKEAKERRRP